MGFPFRRTQSYKLGSPTPDFIQSNLPKKQAKLVLAWAEIHQDELLADWELVMNGEEPFKIQPLQ
jgi:hypothetical protein